MDGGPIWHCYTDQMHRRVLPKMEDSTPNATKPEPSLPAEQRFPVGPQSQEEVVHLADDGDTEALTSAETLAASTIPGRDHIPPNSCFPVADQQSIRSG